MHLPKKFIDSLQGVPGFEQESFEFVHQSNEQITSVRLNPSKLATTFQTPEGARSDYQIIELLTNASRFTTHDSRFTIHDSRLTPHAPVPWCKHAYYLRERPVFTLDPLLHAGAYYVQEPSSMFLDHMLRQLFKSSDTIKILDLCAAPGGKTTLFSSLPFSKFIVANEIIKSRVNVLHENVVKWGASNVFVTNNDPKDFARLPGFFDLIVVDAPCSGSGMFRKDEIAIREWSEQAVKLCGERQKRILGDIMPALTANGWLIYSTCSYSKTENEDNLDWLCQNFDLDSVRIEFPVDWGIVETQSDLHHSFGYRFYPDRLKGEGFFVACLLKKSGAVQRHLNSAAADFVKKEDKKIMAKWTHNSGGLGFIKHSDQFLAIPEAIFNDYLRIQNRLSMRKRGVMLGTINKCELVPDHELALSTIISRQLPFTDLSLEAALQYLRKQSFNFDLAIPGWNLARYCGLNLGWIKVLSNRINNYYPSSWRIRMQ